MIKVFSYYLYLNQITNDFLTEARRSIHLQHAVCLFLLSSNPLLSVVVDHKWRKDSFKG